MVSIQELLTISREYGIALEDVESFKVEFSQILAQESQLNQRKSDLKRRLDTALETYREEYPSTKTVNLDGFNATFDIKPTLVITNMVAFLQRLVQHCENENEPIEEYVNVNRVKVESLIKRMQSVSGSPLALTFKTETVQGGDGYAFVGREKTTLSKLKD